MVRKVLNPGSKSDIVVFIDEKGGRDKWEVL